VIASGLKAGSKVKSSHSLLGIERHLPEVYTLLADVIVLGAPDRTYVQALLKVLTAAQASEQQAPLHLTSFPLLCCQAAGGNVQRAVPAAAAWRSLHIAAKLLDDVEDGDIASLSSCPSDLRDTSSRTDPTASARVINLSTGFIAASNLALTQLAPSVWHALQPDCQRAVLKMAGGQHVELDGKTTLDLGRYNQVMAAKSGVLFALAARAGAMCAPGNQQYLNLFNEFGYNVGMLVQLLDDLADWRRSDGRGDIAMGHCTLPVYYALEVALPSEAAKLEKLLAQARTDRTAEEEAWRLMTMLGADVYLLAEIGRHEDNALSILKAIDRATSTGTGSTRKGGVELMYQWLTNLVSITKQPHGADPSPSDVFQANGCKPSDCSSHYLPGQE
jgi:geranylgeranyl pyrophosphate synthase